MKRVPLLAAVCLFLTRNTAPAPIYGPFPGLEEVIKGADFVVVAVINKRPDMTDMGAGGIYEIEIVKVLKGDTKEGKRSAYLRDLPIDVGSQMAKSLTNGFLEGHLYLLFLCKPGTHTHDEHGKPLSVDYEDENCAGDAVWINQGHEGWEPKLLDSLIGKSVKDATVILLQYSAKHHRDVADIIDAMVAGQRSGE